MNIRSLDIVKSAASKRILLTSGIVCAIPFVFPYAAILSWFCYVPLAIYFIQASDRHSLGAFFIRFFLFGYGFYTVGYLWLGELYPLDFVGFDTVQSVCVLLLAIIVVPAIHAALLACSAAGCRLMCKQLSSSWKLFAFPCVIVLAEYLQSLGALAFPWCRVFVTQAAFPVLLQGASLFGSYSITFLVILCSALIGYAIIKRTYRKLCLCLATALFFGNAIFGFLRLDHLNHEFAKPEHATFGAAVLQGNIPSGEKWNGNVSDMYERYIKLSDQAISALNDQGISTETSLILLPESALPVTLYETSRYTQAFKDYVNQTNANLAVGAFSDQEGLSGNAVYLFSPPALMSKPYIKQHLVPFGEYLPYRAFFERFIPPLAEISVFSEDLAFGNDPALFDTPLGQVGTLICYESIFGEICRQSVLEGAEIILVSTNDSWFGSSGALRHHLAQAQMRAIENNVPILRAANTGISALIRPDGRIYSSLGADQTGYLAGSLPYGTGDTLYTSIGDAILYVLLLYMVLCGIMSCIKKK